jgi:hypothetical protein
MDTDDLTEPAYAVLPRAHEVLDVLRVEIGASAREYSSEDDLLRGTLKRLKGILNDPDSYLDSWNYLDTAEPKQFVEGVRSPIDHVEKTLSTPQHQRGKAVSE